MVVSVHTLDNKSEIENSECLIQVHQFLNMLHYEFTVKTDWSMTSTT